MANGNLIMPPTGNCPNGCKAPQYDNEKCSNQMMAGKAYRNCPWIGDGSINDAMCKDCGSVLLPKNQYGYARTRAGLFNGNTLNNLSNLVTIPNNILQGDLKAAGNNTIRSYREKILRSNKFFLF